MPQGIVQQRFNNKMNNDIILIIYTPFTEIPQNFCNEDASIGRNPQNTA